MKWRIVLSTGVVCLAAAAAASFSELRGVVRGTQGHHVMVEVRPTDGRMDGWQRTQVRVGGEYEFRQLPAGNYWLRVSTEQGDVIDERALTLQGPVVTVETEIKSVAGREAAGSVGVVSAQRVRHVVPKGAKKEFGRYLASREEEDWAEAEEHLEKALALDGEFVEAWVNLGALHTRRRQWAQAAAEFERALAIDPGCAPAWANRAFVYLHTGNAKAAEEAAKKALRYEPGNETTRYLLRLAELNQGKTPH